MIRRAACWSPWLACSTRSRSACSNPSDSPWPASVSGRCASSSSRSPGSELGGPPIAAASAAACSACSCAGSGRGMSSSYPTRPARNSGLAIVRDETQLEQLDRNTVELLNELRVASTAIQVLFAFLLIVPFNVGRSPHASSPPSDLASRPRSHADPAQPSERARAEQQERAERRERGILAPASAGSACGAPDPASVTSRRGAARARRSSRRSSTRWRQAIPTRTKPVRPKHEPNRGVLGVHLAMSRSCGKRDERARERQQAGDDHGPGAVPD